MKCTNYSARWVQIFGDRWSVQNLWWMKYAKSGKFLWSLNMDTAKLALCQLWEHKLCITSETHADVVVLVVRVVRVLCCLVCMKVPMLSFIKLGCIRCHCCMKENILNFGLSPFCLVCIKFLMLSVIKLGCKRCIDWKL